MTLKARIFFYIFSIVQSTTTFADLLDKFDKKMQHLNSEHTLKKPTKQPRLQRQIADHSNITKLVGDIAVFRRQFENTIFTGDLTPDNSNIAILDLLIRGDNLSSTTNLEIKVNHKSVFRAGKISLNQNQFRTIYYGPLAFSKYRIDLRADILTKKHTNSTLPEDSIHIIDKTLWLSNLKGTKNTRYSIILQLSKGQDSNISINSSMRQSVLRI